MKRIIRLILIGMLLWMSHSFADTLILKNGLKLEGKFKGGTTTAIQFETSGSVQEVALSDIQTITFSQTAAKEPAAAAAVATPAASAVSTGQVKSIPAGTKMMVKFTESVNTMENATGSKFKAALEQNLTVNGVVVAPKGTLVYGTVLESVGGRRVGKQRIMVTFDQISINNQMVSIKTDDLGAEGGRGGAARKVGAGALIGAAAGDAGAGAAVGAGLALLGGGKHIQIAPGTLAEVSIKETVTLQ
jgi:effector-binding domain-containing protein